MNGYCDCAVCGCEIWIGVFNPGEEVECPECGEAQWVYFDEEDATYYLDTIPPEESYS